MDELGQMSGTRSIEVKFARGLLEFELSSATTLSSGCILLDNSMDLWRISQCRGVPSPLGLF
ncbi:hypothetical protein KIN20_021802 [Parelaphostrongylus tenuis]|uniref:Uncharacterized protein n=1 Tax=Parelaphostrongylus tenuis TaxID=148309 RepID=A0AAD5QUE5_PARTN|nr:hypothetical protein KIN20_021802 [Parelaphostrongylus tenuis]